jgi:arsenate reductase
MAEGFSRTFLKDEVLVTSAGLEASTVNPTAVQVMSEIGIDISNHTSKSLSDFKPEDYDVVISLCDCGFDLPEEWMMQKVFQDWQFDDPEGQPIETFRRVRDKIKRRVETLPLLLDKSLIGR